MAISLLYNAQPIRLFEADGDFASGALAHFYLARTTTPLTVFTDAPLAIPHPWPVVADAFGLLPPIYIEKGIEYKIRIEDANGNILYAADSIDNPAEPDSAAGGGIVVTSAQVHQTGDIIWNAVNAVRVGWVQLNGKTVGPDGSTADWKHGTDYKALYFHLWNNFSNNLCPVSSGRGANPQADWDTNKSIATLDMRGYGTVGLDDMGNSDANRIQIATTFGTTNGSANAAVGSTAGLCAGMIINSTGIAAGTKIAAITGSTTITLSANATSTVAGVPARFSMFVDAKIAGSPGGELAHVQLVSELATHTHTVVGAPGVAYINAAGVNLTSGGSQGASGNVGLNTTGSSSPMNLQTPARLGSYYIKM